MEERQKNMYIGYEYKQIVVPSEYSSMYMDCYEAFGWHVDEMGNCVCGWIGVKQTHIAICLNCFMSGENS